MITEQAFLEEVAKTKADFKPFVDSAVEIDNFRKIVIHHLCKSEYINVYYHSYLILEKATEINPEVFYPYWNEFVDLLRNKNSYHRNYGMAILANLVKVDDENRFEIIFDDYYKQLDDDKISTKKYCIVYSEKIIKSKPKLSNKIVSKIINSLQMNTNSEKHQDFLLLTFFELILNSGMEIIKGGAVYNFIHLVFENSKSMNVRKKITQIMNNAVHKID